jgi:hypothetical protein
MRITRSEVLKAIRTEPLRGGQWIFPKQDRHGQQVFDKTCKVCAVGGLLRTKGIPDDEISVTLNDYMFYSDGVKNGAVDECGDEKFALESKDYLTALSIKFEKLANKHGSGVHTRKKLAEFVKANFPKQFNVKI